MDVLNELPLWIKAGWGVLAVWAVAQAVWYQRVHVAPPPASPGRSDSSSRRPAAKPMSAALPIGGSPEFLAELGLHTPPPDSGDDALESVYR